jgi:ribosomal protein S18 acetylase RimI-like enzyme
LEVTAVGPPIVRSATETDRKAVCDVVTLAFVTDPLARWALPDPTQYLASFPDFVDAFGGRGLVHGATYVADGLQGAALWLPPGIDPDEARMNTIMATAVAGAALPDLAGVFERMAGYHPREPHWYLPLIGVDPAQQGRGYGAALMRHAVQRFDADGVAAYLESSNPRNIPLYQRHGFEILDTIQVGSSPVVTPMLRRPQ